LRSMLVLRKSLQEDDANAIARMDNIVLIFILCIL